MKLPGSHLLTDLREYWRELGLPECPHCGGAGIHPSRPRWWERSLSWAGLFPYRCEHCLRRSYLRALTSGPQE